MDWFHCINVETGERYFANEVYDLPKDMLLDGKILFLVRSPNNEQHPADDYFAGKKRRFDLQFQFCLAQPLPGPLWYGVELSQPLPCLGVFRTFLLRTVLNCVQLMNPHSFVCDLRAGTMAFAVNRSMDRLVRTTSNGKAQQPKLGEPVYESPSSIAQRAKNGRFDWNTDDTYTSACLSAYFDFFHWQVLQLSALPAMDLRRLIGPQHFHFVMYCGKPGCDGTTKLLSLELSNGFKVPLGPCAAKLALH